MDQTDSYRNALIIAHGIKRYQETLTHLQAVKQKIKTMQQDEVAYVSKLSQESELTLVNTLQFHRNLELDIDYEMAQRSKTFLHKELLSIQSRILDRHIHLQSNELEPIVNTFFRIIQEPEHYDYDIAKVVQDELHQALTVIRNQTLNVAAK